MKHTIHGFSQKELITIGLDNDDAAVLRWLIDFQASGKMKSKIIDGKQYYWVLYSSVLEYLPIIANNKYTIKRIFENLVKSGVLYNYTHVAYKDDGLFPAGTYSMYAINGDVYSPLITSPLAEMLDPLSRNASHPLAEMLDPPSQNCSDKDSSNNYSSNNDNNSPSAIATGSMPSSKNQEEESIPHNPSKKKQKEPKHKYGSENNVLMTDSQHEKLKNELGIDMLNDCIEELSVAKAMKGYKYTRDDLAIRKWVISAVMKKRGIDSTSLPSSFSSQSIAAGGVESEYDKKVREEKELYEHIKNERKKNNKENEVDDK